MAGPARTDPMISPSSIACRRSLARPLRFALHFILLILVWPIAFEVGGHADERTATSVADRTDARRADAGEWEKVHALLAARCFKCHGPGGDPQAGLRLDSREAALKTLDSGQRAVVPGRPVESELLARVASPDAGLRMPLEGEPLTADEIARIRGWIAAGAQWPEHWAYRPLLQPRIPRDRKSATVDLADESVWPRSPIDVFVLERLQRAGLSPAAMADKRTLIRRVSLDLIGLPPTPVELDAFLEDDAPDAYERLVDRLLASPRYGERWARHWMDVVHFAETHGHDQDRPREHAWPYRDYLIRAFNDDVPYTRFVENQIAGDVLHPYDPLAITATGLLAAGPWDESSLRDIREDTLDREIARYLDRDDIVTTVMSTFASSTVHCARCHDHKFDPVTQAEYYGLQAVFAATDKANRRYDLSAATARRRDELLTALAELPARVAARDPSLDSSAVRALVTNWEAEQAAERNVWQLPAEIEVRSASGAALQRLEDGSWLAGGASPSVDVYHATLTFSQSQVTAIALEVLPHESLPKQGPGRAVNGNLHLGEFLAWQTSAEHPDVLRKVTFQEAQADFNQEGWMIAHATDGNPTTAWGIHPQEGRPHRAVFRFDHPAESKAGRRLRVELHQVFPQNHLIGRFRLLLTSEPDAKIEQIDPLEPEVAAALQVPEAQRSIEQRLMLAAHVLRRNYETELAGLPAQVLVYCGTNDFQADGTFLPSEQPRAVQVLHRGDVAQPRAAAHPGALACVPGLDSVFREFEMGDEGARRRALAAWLTHPENGLAWRSIANRVWHYHFGQGLVDTPNDFGRLGAAPSHPELLDWLAAELRNAECGPLEGRAAVQSGAPAGLKRLHRLIVTSAVYRQSVQHRPDCARIDAGNRLLWRMNRRRMEAEAIRDAVLQMAGTLDSTMGGPSVRQFHQEPGVHVTPVVDYIGFDVDDPALRRRSVYRFLFRTLPDPFMDALDCPDASQLAPERTESLTALQALAMLNDQLLVRQCEHLAERAAGSGRDPRDQIEFVYRHIFCRRPTPDELSAVIKYVSRHGLANACRFLINTNEFLFVE